MALLNLCSEAMNWKCVALEGIRAFDHCGATTVRDSFIYFASERQQMRTTYVIRKECDKWKVRSSEPTYINFAGASFCTCDD